MTLNEFGLELMTIVKRQEKNTAILRKAEVVNEKAWAVAGIIGDPRDIDLDNLPTLAEVNARRGYAEAPQ
jgi:hypothetical protein